MQENSRVAGNWFYAVRSLLLMFRLRACAMAAGGATKPFYRRSEIDSFIFLANFPPLNCDQITQMDVQQDTGHMRLQKKSGEPLSTTIEKRTNIPLTCAPLFNLASTSFIQYLVV